MGIFYKTKILYDSAFYRFNRQQGGLYSMDTTAAVDGAAVIVKNFRRNLNT